MKSDSIKNGFVGAVGDTPLIRLKKMSELTGCEILGKAEFLNPGGSVKDRAALALIETGEKQGVLKKGGTVVEGTAGNTGIGLTLVANTKGYKTLIVIPETQSQEKIDLLRTLGAEVKLVPALPYSDPGNFNHVAKRMAAEITGGFWANQFDNVANREAHYQTTGPEIWEQTQGKITGFVTAVGTGGTLAGTSRFLKEKNAKIKTICVDPHGASIWSFIKRGNLDFDDGDSVTEGIGQARVTENLAGAPIDDAYRIGDRPMIEMLYHLLKVEGLFLGSSSALNVCGALRLAREGGRGQTIVTLLCDGGARYSSRLFNQEWLKQKNLVPISTRLEDFWDSFMKDLD